MGKWRKAVKAAFNLVKNCKALWKGVRPKCLKSIRCATTIVTQCLNKKACRVGAIKKIHQCAVREGMAAVKKACKGKETCQVLRQKGRKKSLQIHSCWSPCPPIRRQSHQIRSQTHMQGQGQVHEDCQCPHHPDLEKGPA